MTTKLEWKNFNKVPLGLNPQNTSIQPHQSLLEALGNAQGQLNFTKEQLLILAANTQGSALIDLTGISGVYQMSEADSQKAVIIFINTDLITQVSLFDSQNNPARYLMANCPYVGQPTPLELRAGLNDTIIQINESMITEVSYGYYQALEFRPFKIAAGMHGEVEVTESGLEWIIRDGKITANKLAGAVQADINSRQLLSEKGQALGYVPLDANIKIPTEFLPTSIVGATKFKGFFDATTGIVTSSDPAINGLPIPAASPANEGWYFITQVPGPYVLDGITPWYVGDVAISYGIAWGQIDNTDSVTSVNGQTGPVSLDTGDIPSILNKRYVTDAELAVLVVTSGSNTGDETAATIKSKLGITTLSGSNTGDETTASIKAKLGITTLSGVNTGDQTSIVGIAGTIAQFNAACTDASFATGGGSATGTNTGDQTSIVGIAGTIAQFNTACTDADFATGGGNVSGNSSGTNTGDETAATIKAKLGITTLSGSNTGDQTSIVGIAGTIAQFNTACSDADFATGGGTAIGTNTGDQTSIVGIAGTIAQFNTACTDADFATGGGSATGSNTGDETAATIKSKLGITTLSGSNTGDQTSIVGISGTIAEFNTACSDADFATGGGSATGSNTGDETAATIKSKLGITTLSGSNTGDQTSIVGIAGTIAQFNTACTDADFATGGGTATGSNTGDQTSIVGIAGTIAQFNTACTDADFATGGGSATGSNTGDETAATIKSKLGITTLSGSNTGDQTSIVGIAGTIAQFNTACTDADFATGGGSATGSNTGDETAATIKSKLGITTLSGSNTGDQTSIVGIAGTIAQFNTACTDADFAPVASPAFTGTPTAPTAAANNNSTQIATTAYVDAQTANAIYQATPADPATTTSSAGVMMGLAGSITPVRSGKVLVTISGDMDNSGSGNSVTAQIRTGTGAAPANGAALAGTARSGNVQATNASVALANPICRFPFSVQAIVSGLTLNTAVWVDLGVSAQGGNTARVRNISISAVEL